MSRAEKEISQISEIVSVLQGLSTIPVIEIDANRFIRPLVSSIKRELAFLTEDVSFNFYSKFKRANLFSNSIPITNNQAKMMLKFGIKEYSHCG